MKRRWMQSAMGVVLSTAAVIACGETRDVLTRHADAGGGAGASGGSSSDGQAGKGGSNNETGLTGGVGATAVGGSGAAGGTSVLPKDGGVLPDPHAAQRKELADAYCSALDTYACLIGPAEESDVSPVTSTECSRIIQLDEYDVGEACWNDLVALMQCLATAPHQCPCSGNDCFLQGPLADPVPAPCDDTAFNACRSRQPSGKVSGSHLVCEWSLSSEPTPCYVYCSLDPARQFVGACAGPPNGPYDCSVTLNQRALVDDLNGTSALFYADDCASVATAMANGDDGVGIVDCCVTWRTSVDAGAANNDRCSCTADPVKAGFASCAAAAAAGQGEVVDLCPEYVAPPNFGGGNFPTP